MYKSISKIPFRNYRSIKKIIQKTKKISPKNIALTDIKYRQKLITEKKYFSNFDRSLKRVFVASGILYSSLYSSFIGKIQIFDSVRITAVPNTLQEQGHLEPQWIINKIKCKVYDCHSWKYSRNEVDIINKSLLRQLKECNRDRVVSEDCRNAYLSITFYRSKTRTSKRSKALKDSKYTNKHVGNNRKR